MKYFGLTEALPWPQEEVVNDDTSLMYTNTPKSSLNAPPSGGEEVGKEYSREQPTVGEIIEDTKGVVGAPVMEM